MLEELLHLDKEIFLFLNNLGTPGWDGLWLFITNKWSSIPLYVLLLILTYKFLGLRKTLLILVTITILITVTDQLSNFFKLGVQRLRPCYDPELSGLVRLVKASCGGKYGYFSAHAANSFATAFFFLLLLKKRYNFLLWILLPWAIIVAGSRIYIGVHFPLDIISGALIGMLMAWLFARLYIFAVDKYQI
jgi:undecaprenyl-diphosphatase